MYWFWLLIVCSSGFDVFWNTYEYKNSLQHHYDWCRIRKDYVYVSHPELKQAVIIKQKQNRLLTNFGNTMTYRLGSSTNLELETSGQYLMIKLTFVDEQYGEGEKFVQLTFTTNTTLNNILPQLQTQPSFSSHCKELNKQGNYKCEVPFTLTLYPEHKNEQQIQAAKESKQKFMKSAGLSSKYDKITTNAINSLIGSICSFEGEEDTYMGWCDENGYETKLSLLPLTLLKYIHPTLGNYIFTSMLNYLETQLLYTNHQDGQPLPLPQHIQFINNFLQNNSNPLVNSMGKKILNSYITVPMLTKISTLQQEINYRQGKKLHPYLMQMLTQRWSSNTKLQTYKSIYTQSFTHDFKYHEYGHHLISNPGKSAWLYKVVENFGGLLVRDVKGKMAMAEAKEEYQEIFTLMNILRTYISDEDNGKKGHYTSIIGSQDMRFYSKYIGYDALLPFAYGAGNALPADTLSQLSSPFGLKSSNIEDSSEKYRFRGDIHVYFNYVILKNMKERLESQASLTKDQQKFISLIKQLLRGIQSTVLESFNNDGIIYTSWTSSGASKESIAWLRIISVMILTLEQ